MEETLWWLNPDALSISIEGMKAVSTKKKHKKHILQADTFIFES
jgi:hypothetical protein